VASSAVQPVTTQSIIDVTPRIQQRGRTVQQRPLITPKKLADRIARRNDLIMRAAIDAHDRISHLVDHTDETALQTRIRAGERTPEFETRFEPEEIQARKDFLANCYVAGNNAVQEAVEKLGQTVERLAQVDLDDPIWDTQVRSKGKGLWDILYPSKDDEEEDESDPSFLERLVSGKNARRRSY
jgi:hypothetical protein